MAKDNDYQLYLAETRNLVDSKLSNLSQRIADLRLIKKIEYVLQSHGKRLRPVLLLLSAQNVGAEREDVMQLALAIELLHTATLVHDDILDQDNFRRNALAAHAKWSVKEAILIGDALASFALNLAADYGGDVLKTVSQTSLLLCDGEYLDVNVTKTHLSENEYLEKIRRKSASLFKAAAQCGTIAGGGSHLEVESLSRFGENLGMAYQIKDDLADIAYLRNRVPRDLKDCRATFPLVRLYESSNAAEKESLVENLNNFMMLKDSRKQKFWKEIRMNLKNNGSAGYCCGKIDEYLAQATLQISGLRDNCFKSYLCSMAESLRPKASDF